MIEEVYERLSKEEAEYKEAAATLRERIQEQELKIDWLELTNKEPDMLFLERSAYMRNRDEQNELCNKINRVRINRQNLDRIAGLVKANREWVIQVLSCYI